MKKKDIHFRLLDPLFVRFATRPYQQAKTVNQVYDFFENDHGKNALLLSSSVLNDKRTAIDKGKVLAQKKKDKLDVSLTKYFLRAHSRATPFGLYAGIDHAEWGEESKLLFETEKPESIVTTSCIDVDLMHVFLTKLSSFPELIEQLEFKPNETLYRVGNQYRYTETIKDVNSKKYELSAFAYDAFYSRLFDFCKPSKKPKDIISYICESAEVSLEESTEFFHQLITSNVLVHAFELSISGKNMLQQFEAFIEFSDQFISNETGQKLIQLAYKTIANLKEFDRSASSRTRVLKEILDDLSRAYPNFNPSNFVQVNARPLLAKKTLNSKFKISIEKCIRVLSRLSDQPRQKFFERFKDDFLSKFGEKKVPLLRALDPENGINYGTLSPEQMDKSPLLADLAFPAFANSNAIELSNNEYFLLDKINQTIASGEHKISIWEKDISVSSRQKRFLPTLPVSFSIYEENNSPLIHLHCVGQSSGINTLARFSEQDEKILETLQQVNELEKAYYKDHIVAELVHLPEARMGNVVHRPIFRDYDITYLGKSGQKNSRQIPINDLLICVEDDEIRVYSEKHQKYVMPRLSNAHNYDYRTTQVYQFLCHLQFQKKQDGIYFSWGNLAHLFDHLPRVEIEGVIVSKERWIINYDQIKRIQQTDQIATYFKEQKWPLQFLILQGDNYLPIDLTNIWSTQLFKAEIARKKRLEIEEQFDFSTSILKNQCGEGIVHEFAAVMHQPNQTSNHTKVDLKPTQTKLKTRFEIGSEWLYFKIFTGVKTAEQILADVILPLVKEEKEKGHLRQWFFIKYNERGNHLRVRFNLVNTASINKILDHFNALMDKHHYVEVSSVELAIYEREIERYDPLLIETVECLFSVGSSIAAELIQIDLNEEVQRWKFAAVICDQYMERLNCDLKMKQEICSALSQSFVEEHAFNKHQRKLLDKKYRKLEPELYLLLTENSIEQNFVAQKLNQTNLFHEINHVFQTKTPSISKSELIFSLLHMELNRLFRSNQRKNELVIYYCLDKMYRSIIARRKHSSAKEKVR